MASDETETDETDDEAAAPTLYLVWHDPAATPEAPLDLHGDGHPLADGLWLLLPAGAVGAQVYWMALCVKRARHYNI